MTSPSAQELIHLLLDHSQAEIDGELRQAIQRFQTDAAEEDLIFVLLELRKRIKELESQS